MDTGPNPSRFAYVTIHYEGTKNDDAYALAVKVLVHSIKISGTEQDVVVLVSENVSEKTKASLRSVGAIVVVIQNIPNPYEHEMRLRRTFKSRFLYTFNKLYLWALTQYERVVYMDADNIALYNMDELFRCGHFCVVFMNPLLFHTGLMVVKPDREAFDKLFHTLQSGSKYSYDGADQGFLTEYFQGVDLSPLFRPEELPDGELSEEPAMRLSIGYNMNSLYYYLDYDYHLFRRSNNSFSDLQIPALSMGYPIAPYMKPWYWYATFFFNSVWEWHAVRESIPGESGFGVLLSRYFLLVAVFFPVGVWLIRTWASLKATPLKAPARAIVSAHPAFIGFIVGIIVPFLTNFFWATRFIPALLPPVPAWWIYFPYHIFGTYYVLNIWFYLLLHPTVSPRAQPTKLPQDDGTFLQSLLDLKWLGMQDKFSRYPLLPITLMLPPLFFEILFVIAGILNIYNHFVIKLAVQTVLLLIGWMANVGSSESSDALPDSA